MKRQSYKRVEEFGTDFQEKVLYINRCSKVVKGGRKFSFSALVLVGDGRGHVGLGFAKANEVADAIRKATEAARKSVLTFEMEGGTIPHEVTAKSDGSTVFLKPALDGTGIIAGSSVRSVLELCGFRDIVAKSYGSNKNQVRATMLALSSLMNREETLALRKRAV